ncbi:hypothetical protein H6761_02505 [Candidatus Nomurabacteria bacterium]|nr:hypothetical protein [Candidatus Nomurabacteria bacterium]
MKKHFHFHFYLRIFLFAILAISFVFFIYQKTIKANTGGGGLNQEDFQFHGWAWSPNIGWLTLNCYNDFDGDGELTAADNYCASVRDGHPGLGAVDFGLYLDASADESVRAVGGCAWADSVGWWICFDDPGLAGSTLAPDYGVYLNDYYWPNDSPSGLSPAASLVPNALYHGGGTWGSQDSNGHASIVILEGETDWTNELGFPIDAIGAPSGSLESCFNCQETKTCSHDSGISCTADAECDALSPGSTCDVNRTCDNCLEYTYNVDGSLASSVAGYQCSDCLFNGPDGVDTRCTENAYQNNQNTCSSCVNYYDIPGLLVDYATATNDGAGYMCGWAWNQDSGSGNGVGWIQFSPRITAGNNPYFQVDAGDIYSKGKIRSNYILAPDIYNAYIIEAGGDIFQLNASSSKDGLSYLQNRPLINFPSSNGAGKYVNALGKIDYDGLITEVGSTGKNKYGSTLDLLPPGSSGWSTLIDNGGKIELNNTVYYSPMPRIFNGFPSSLIIDNAVNKENGSGVVVFGGGPVLIANNIVYSSDVSSIDRLKDIGSVVWVIKGDLWVDRNVSEISGTFIVLGADGTDCAVDEWNCGRFISSYDSPIDSQLKINGTVIAKKFVLERTYNTDNEPAEKFINDGRLQVNPPAGLQNFADSLPQFDYTPY